MVLHWMLVIAVLSFLSSLSTANAQPGEISEMSAPAQTEAVVLPEWAIGPFARVEENPLLVPTSGWEALHTYNPAVLIVDGRFAMLYRAQDIPHEQGGKDQIGLAWSDDGIHWERYPGNPVLEATEDYELPGGSQDPRVVRHDGVYYMTYTAWSPPNCYLSIATSEDLVHWTKHGPLFPELRWTKSGTIVQNPSNEAVRIDGRFVMYVVDWKPFYIAYSDDLLNWEIKELEGELGGESGIAVTDYADPGEDDIVLFYSGALENRGDWFYAVGEALFSRDDPERRLAFLEWPVIRPLKPYEMAGNKENCVFASGLLRHQGRWWLYAGAGDHVVALYTAPAKAP